MVLQHGGGSTLLWASEGQSGCSAEPPFREPSLEDGEPLTFQRCFRAKILLDAGPDRPKPRPRRAPAVRFLTKGPTFTQVDLLLSEPARFCRPHPADLRTIVPPLPQQRFLSGLLLLLPDQQKRLLSSPFLLLGFGVASSPVSAVLGGGRGGL